MTKNKQWTRNDKKHMPEERTDKQFLILRVHVLDKHFHADKRYLNQMFGYIYPKHQKTNYPNTDSI